MAVRCGARSGAQGGPHARATRTSADFSRARAGSAVDSGADGFESDAGVIYYAGSRERVRVPFDDELVELTVSSINALRGIALAAHIPPPLEDSPKCPRCSLVGICLPDEVRFLNRPAVEPRPLFPALQDALPLYVQSPRAFVRKDGEVFVIVVEKEKVAEARLLIRYLSGEIEEYPNFITR